MQPCAPHLLSLCFSPVSRGQRLQYIFSATHYFQSGPFLFLQNKLLSNYSVLHTARARQASNRPLAGSIKPLALLNYVHNEAPQKRKQALECATNDTASIPDHLPFKDHDHPLQTARQQVARLDLPNLDSPNVACPLDMLLPSSTPSTFSVVLVLPPVRPPTYVLFNCRVHQYCTYPA